MIRYFIRDIFGSAMVVAIIAAGTNRGFGQSAKVASPPPPKVFVTAVRRDTVSEPKIFVGTVKPLRKSIVGSAAPGRVEEYLVNEGDFVEKGKPIAILRRGIIAAEKRAAEAVLDVRKAELLELEQSFDAEVDQARAKLSMAEAHSSFRDAKRDRTKSLGDAVTQETLQEDTSMAAQTQASVQEARAVLRMLLNGPREQKHAQARARIANQEAEVERLSEQFERHTMVAPFNGYVTAEHTEIGQWLMQGDPIAEIAELDVVDVEVPVLEDYISLLDTTVVGSVDVPALRGRRFDGVVSVINPQADARARTFPVKVRVQNETKANVPLLKAGMFARVTLPVGEPLDTQLVPKDAIVIGGRTAIVYATQTEGNKTTVRAVPVTPGVSRGLWITVGKEEIKEGELVVIEGNERLRPLQEVRIEQKQIPYAK